MAKNIVRIDKYTDDNKIPTAPRKATYRYILLFDHDGIRGREVEYSDEGFDIKGDSVSIIYYEGDKIPPLIDEN